MPQVRRQLGEEALDICPLAIPSHDPHNGGGMPEIMQTGLGAHPIMTDNAGTGPQLAEEAIDAAIAYWLPCTGGKERRGVPGRMR
jgi:hypothetical protein